MKKSFIIMICLFLFMEAEIRGESVTKTVNFSHSELKIDTITGKDGEIYNTVSYGNIGTDGECGNPTLPIEYIFIPIPFLAENISLNVEKNDVTSEFLTNKIFPIQEDIPTLIGNYNTSFISCDSCIYSTTFPYPKQIAWIVSIPTIGESSRFVRVAISPIQYYPKDNKIDFAECIDITIDYTISTAEENNPQLTKIRVSQIEDIGIPFYEYCIITSNSLKDSFERLVAWRRQNGLKAGVVCMEEILNNTNIQGDTVSRPALCDSAGKVRQYLQYAYASGITKYVLFGGNDSIVPIRYGTGGNNLWTSDPNEPNDYKIPSDFYFSELYSNWNKDKDKYLGEPEDSLNYGGQLYVGRILCEKPEEVENYTNKMMRYEMCPGNGDTSYLTKVFFQQSDQMQEHHEAQSVSNILGGNFTTIKIIEETPGPYETNTTAPLGKEVIDSMNCHYGYVNWYGHGCPFAIAVKTNSRYGGGLVDHYCNPYCISSFPNAETFVPFMIHEDGNSLTSLNNQNYPMFAFSFSCMITPFDTYNDYSGHPNIGQSFTLGKDYGGPVLVGNTRYGWTISSHLFHKIFNNYVVSEPVGKALLLAKASFCSTISPTHYIAHSTNIIGCPFVRLWTDIPSIFSAVLSCYSNSYVISANSLITDAEIDVRDITQSEEVIDTICFNPSQGSKTLTNVGNGLITLTGKNCLPQILPLSIQNSSLHGSHYVIVKDADIGKNVRNGNHGNVIFEESSDYTFETKGTFRLAKGVLIKHGAKLKVIPSIINY